MIRFQGDRNIEALRKVEPADLKLEAVIFDMDGLMLNTERIYIEAWQAAAEQMQIAFDLDNYLQCIGLNWTDTQALLMRLNGPDFPLEELARISKELYHGYLQERDDIAKPDLANILSYLTAAGIPTGVGTSTHRVLAEQKLIKVAAADHIKTLVAGDDVSEGKPNPETYHTVARNLGVPIERCVILEDSYNGVKGAHASSAVPIMIPDLKQPTPEIGSLCYRICDSLTHTVDTILKPAFQS